MQSVLSRLVETEEVANDYAEDKDTPVTVYPHHAGEAEKEESSTGVITELFTFSSTLTFCRHRLAREDVFRRGSQVKR